LRLLRLVLDCQPCICLLLSCATTTTVIYTLSLHDALPISRLEQFQGSLLVLPASLVGSKEAKTPRAAREKLGANLAISGTVLRTDRQSTRLNSSHGSPSYAVFCVTQTRRGRPPTSAASGRD